MVGLHWLNSIVLATQVVDSRFNVHSKKSEMTPGTVTQKLQKSAANDEFTLALKHMCRVLQSPK